MGFFLGMKRHRRKEERRETSKRRHNKRDGRTRFDGKAADTNTKHAKKKKKGRGVVVSIMFPKKALNAFLGREKKGRKEDSIEENLASGEGVLKDRLPRRRNFLLKQGKNRENTGEKK